MVRHASDNLTKAVAMARNGHEEGFRAAWLICNELEGGATTWGNAQRAFKAVCKAAELAEQQPPPTPTPTPMAKTKGKANAARTAETVTRTGTIVPPRVQRTSLQVAKALELHEYYAEEHKRVHKMATLAYAETAKAGKLRKPGSKPKDIAAKHDAMLSEGSPFTITSAALKSWYSNVKGQHGGLVSPAVFLYSVVPCSRDSKSRAGNFFGTIVTLHSSSVIRARIVTRECDPGASRRSHPSRRSLVARRAGCGRAHRRADARC